MTQNMVAPELFRPPIDFPDLPEELVAFVGGKLASYKKLHVVEFIDAIPKTPSGKILRRQLKEREKASWAAQQGQR